MKCVNKDGNKCLHFGFEPTFEGVCSGCSEFVQLAELPKKNKKPRLSGKYLAFLKENYGELRAMGLLNRMELYGWPLPKGLAYLDVWNKKELSVYVGEYGPCKAIVFKFKSNGKTITCHHCAAQRKGDYR